jgi:hypothetical protein
MLCGEKFVGLNISVFSNVFGKTVLETSDSKEKLLRGSFDLTPRVSCLCGSHKYSVSGSFSFVESGNRFNIVGDLTYLGKETDVVFTNTELELTSCDDSFKKTKWSSTNDGEIMCDGKKSGNTISLDCNAKE